jgi:hypothetical protein
MRSTLAFERRGRQHASVHLRFPPSAIRRFRLAGSRDASSPGGMRLLAGKTSDSAGAILAVTV